jgi:comEA protein
MRRTLWNGLAACVAIVALVVTPSALAASKKTPTPTADAADKTAKVNLNTADEKDIAAAKGVGAKLAKALVAGRPYKTWDEVSKVKGVGSGKKLDSLKKVFKLTDGVAAKGETAAADKKDTKKSSKSSSKGEETTSATTGTGAAAGGVATAGKTSAASESSSPSKKSPSSSGKLAPGTKIDINTASAEELDKLPEIGPVKAKAIVDYREANGKFVAPEDIMKVSGIKEGTFAKIKDFIVVK